MVSARAAMKYLLDEAELTALRDAKKIAEAKMAETLQDLCTKVADHMPTPWGWDDDGGPVKPWGCVLTAKSEWYCDECPVIDACPYERKEWSK